MRRSCHTPRVLTLLVLFTSLSFPHLSSPNPASTIGDYDLPGERAQEQTQLASKEESEEEEELFKDVDPKRLAAVLLEALNRSHVVRGSDGETYGSVEEERDPVITEEPYGARVARDRDRQKQLELFIATQGKESERREEEEKEKALEEEERMTEKVTSHTTSQAVQIQTTQPIGSSDGAAESDAAGQPPASDDEEEEQLSPEELRSLEAMMKEFPRLNAASEQTQRNARGYGSYNDVIPAHQGSDLAMSKKKLKWQEETQKAVYFPTFSNSVEESEYGNGIAEETQPPTQAEDEDEEALSPEEEEARAQVEQEEMMRQAAEAQRAKLEEEKLADIASDMLLSYMGKQSRGDRKHAASPSNAVEDKRSDEEQGATEEEDLDPQTIDKLIEISSKLHLPADDVVDIITDVEKKKKKDTPPEVASVRQYASSPLQQSFRSGWQVPTNQNGLPVSKQPSPAVNILKSWFQEKNTAKSDVPQRKLAKPFLPYSFLPREKPFSVNQAHWFQPPTSVWTGYSPYPYPYSAYRQRKPVWGYYPHYYSPVLRPKPRYYLPKPGLTLNGYFGNSVEDPNRFPPKRRYQGWLRPQLRNPPASLKHKSFYSSYFPRLYSQPIQRTAPPLAAPQQKQLPVSAPVTRNKDDRKGWKQPDGRIHDDVEEYIQQILLNRAQRMD